VSRAINSLPSKFKITGCEVRAFRVDLVLGDTNPWAVVEITVCSTMELFSGSLLLSKGKSNLLSCSHPIFKLLSSTNRCDDASCMCSVLCRRKCSKTF